MKELVLAGGGHAHSLFLLDWAKAPIPDTSLTLVSSKPYSPYSGMLPGLVAGHYTPDDIQIDLAELSQKAGARFVCASVDALDPEGKYLFLSDQTEINFDVLSINTGSAPSQTIPGVKEFAVPIKPIAGFWELWQNLKAQWVKEKKPRTIAVVGGGAGSVEIILAMAWACQNEGVKHLKYLLLTKAKHILPGYPLKVRLDAERACAQLGIEIRRDCRVQAVTPEGVDIFLNENIVCHPVFWCTQAAAPSWPRSSGLACTDDGFIKVNEVLQSESHDFIFAAGDIAEFVKSPIPKAGVYPVRQVATLKNNIDAYLTGKKLTPYVPQTKFLSLLSLGGRTATGSRGKWVISGKWVWRWKNRIDRRFMNRFRDFISSNS